MRHQSPSRIWCGRRHDRSPARRLAHFRPPLFPSASPALTADEIARTAGFFSFGTNDLTQTALGISRDDMGNFMMPYIENEVFEKNPFATLDTVGVGQLMRMAVEKGRASRPNIKLGI